MTNATNIKSVEIVLPACETVLLRRAEVVLPATETVLLRRAEVVLRASSTAKRPSPSVSSS